MRAVTYVCVLVLGLAATAGATAPVTVARVYRDNIGPLSVDFTLTPFTFSGNGRDVYSFGFDVVQSAVLMAHLSLDTQTGTLTFVDAVRDEIPVSTFGGVGAAPVLGPAETELYYATADPTSTFARDPATGALTLRQVLRVSGRRSAPYQTAHLTPDGQQLLLGTGEGIAAYPRTPTGLLAPPTIHALEVHGLQDDDGAAIPAAFVVRADGRYVYVLYRATYSDRSGLVVLARDQPGALSVVQQIDDGFDDWVDLASFAPRALALSPDGRFLYATDRDAAGGGIVVLSVDPLDGRIRHARVFGRTESEPSGRNALALSPDGGLLYTNGGALDVWARDAATGALDHVQRIAIGENGAAGAETIVSSADGRFLFTLDGTARVITEFQRRCGDGVVEATDGTEECDDGNFASGDGCDAACRVEPCFACTGAPSTCAPDAGPCDDGDPCTTNDACTGGICRGAPAADGAACDDGNACTNGDECQAGDCIAAGRVDCGACAVCDREVAACVGMLDRGCLEPPGHPVGRDPKPVIPPVGTFDPARPRSLRAKFKYRDPASTAGIGDPTTGTGYSICLLDLNGRDAVFPHERQRRRVVTEAGVPSAEACGHRTCWRDRNDGFAFHARRGKPDGVRRLMLGRTTPGGLRMTAVAGGAAFDVRGLDPPAGAVTLQVFADTGACWQGQLTRRRK